MSLLDDAQRMQEREPWDVGEPAPACVFCQGFKSDGHRSDCPWRSMPKIIKVLEVAEWLAKN